MLKYLVTAVYGHQGQRHMAELDDRHDHLGGEARLEHQGQEF